MMIALNERTAWTIGRLAAGQPLNGVNLDELPDDWREIAEVIDTRRNGVDAGKVLKGELQARFPEQHADLLRLILAADLKAPAPGVLPFAVTSADTILTTVYPEPVWTIPDLLPVGLATLAGRPKKGKSWLAMQVAYAKAAGGYALGKRVTAAPVLYLALEDSPRRIQKRMNIQQWIRGLPVDFVHIGEMKNIGMVHEGGAEKLRQAIHIGGYKLLVIDTLARALRGLDPKKSHLIGNALELLHETAHECDATILLVDHLRKTGANGADGADVIEDLIDSTVKVATVDTVWGLYREQGKRGAKLQVTGKDVDEQTLALELDPVTCCWHSKGNANRILTPNEKKIIEIIRKHGQARLHQIADEAEIDKANARRDLVELVNNGQLSFDEETKQYSLIHAPIYEP